MNRKIAWYGIGGDLHRPCSSAGKRGRKGRVESELLLTSFSVEGGGRSRVVLVAVFGAFSLAVLLADLLGGMSVDVAIQTAL